MRFIPVSHCPITRLLTANRQIIGIMNTARASYTLKLAENEAELLAAQRLRYRVFVEEMGAVADSGSRRDRLERDRFDRLFDHLILIDQSAHSDEESVVGVYRLLRSEVAANGLGFYGEREFDLSAITNSGRSSVELGRSCVDKAHRNGPAMALLWSGLAEYVLSHDIEILFGTASFPGQDIDTMAHGLSYLHYNYLAPSDLRVSANTDHFCPLGVLPADKVDRTTALKQIPSLIKGYLRLGGYVGSGAWRDTAFNTIDVCLLLDTARMSKRHRAYYARGQVA